MSRTGGGVPPRQGGWTLGVLLVVVLAACSGGDDSSDVSLGTLADSTTVSTTSAPTTAAPTTAATSEPTTAPETTQGPTTQAPTTTSVTTSPGEAGTGPPPEYTEVLDTWNAFWKAIPNPRPDGGLRGPAQPAVKDTVANLLYGPGATLPETVETHPRVHLDRGRDQAVVTDCILTRPSVSGEDQSGLHLTGSLRHGAGGWVISSVSFSKSAPHCVPASIVAEPRDVWVRDLELEMGLPDSLGEMEAIEGEELFAQTSSYAETIEEAGAAYQGERELHPVVSAVSHDEAGRLVVTFRSCHTYGDDFGLVADGELLTDLYDPDVRRSDIGEVTRFDDGWLVTNVEGSRRPCEPGDGAIEVVESGWSP